MEELNWKQKVAAYLKEKAKAVPRLILITAGISIVLTIAYYATLGLMSA